MAVGQVLVSLLGPRNQSLFALKKSINQSIPLDRERFKSNSARLKFKLNHEFHLLDLL